MRDCLGITYISIPYIKCQYFTSVPNLLLSAVNPLSQEPVKQKTELTIKISLLPQIYVLNILVKINLPLNRPWVKLYGKI